MFTDVHLKTSRKGNSPSQKPIRRLHQLRTVFLTWFLPPYLQRAKIFAKNEPQTRQNKNIFAERRLQEASEVQLRSF